MKQVNPQFFLNMPEVVTTPGWDNWEDFCLEHSIDPLLNTVQDPIHYFMVPSGTMMDARKDARKTVTSF